MIFSILSLLLLQVTDAAKARRPAGYNRAACQSSTAATLAANCPPGTILVGPTGLFKTIQSAVLSLPHDTTPQTLLIQAGTYTEQVNVTRPGPLTLLGVTSSPNSNAGNTVKVLWHAATGTPETGNKDDAFTATLTVAPTLEAALTGSGPTGYPIPANTPFGNTDFRAYNIDFDNEFKQASAGPSLAVSIGMANAGFYFCGVRSWQDTAFVGKKANAYFYKGEVAGMTDFLYGFGTAWIQSAKVALRGCGGGITAWKGTNTTTPNKYGVYIHDSTVAAAQPGLGLTGKCSLGRPWNSLHRSIFSKCTMDDSIIAPGYVKWSLTDSRMNAMTLMGEYQNFGPGFNAAARTAGGISKLLTDQQYAPYATVEQVFQSPSWIDKAPETASAKHAS